MAGLQAEKIGDVEEGYTPDATEVDELGLTADERAQFDGMREADKGIPEAPEEPEEAPAAETPPEGETAPEPAAEAKKAAPAPEEDDEPDQVTRDPRTGKEQRTISYGKHQRLLKKAREEQEALRAQTEQSRIDHAKLTERLNILNEALTAPSPPQPMTAEQAEYQRQQEIQQNPMLEETIDPSMDLPGAMAQMQRRQIFMANASMQQQDATQEQLADQALHRDYLRDAQAFSQTEEGQYFMGDQGAYQFLKNSRLMELGIALFDKDVTTDQFTQAEINQMISDFNNEEKWVVTNALKTGKSPAKAIMRLATGRGWRPPEPTPAPAPVPPQSVPARPAAARATAPPSARQPAVAAGPTAAARIQQEAAGAAASRSLSDGGGVPPAEPLSPEEMLRMSDEEFGIYIDNLPKQRLDAIMGRESPRRPG